MTAINIGYNVNTNAYFAAMDAMADKSDQAMSRAASAADRWQSSLDTSAGRVGNAAGQVASNFEAANDAITRSAEQSASALDQINQAASNVDLQSWSSKVSTDMGRAYGEGLAQVKTASESVVDWIQSKLIIAGVAVAAGVTVGALTAVYAAYKVVSGTIGFVTGLMTGDSYKSANIDALIAANREVKSLQENLGMAAAKASALRSALAGIGVEQGTYTSSMDKARTAVETNSDELDRLGVKYKDAAGSALPLIEVQRNAVAVLEQYREGWDRNQAAAAIGMGSYRELSEVIKVNEAQISTSLDRLVDYNLVIGEGTQEAVTAYEAAMKAFQHETDLTAQGFKRAIADQIMPILTDLATYFKDGFPFAVRVFRYSMATVTSLFYGLKEVAYITSEAVIQSFGLMGDVVVRVASALQMAVSGNFKGAVDLLMQAPADLGKRWGSFMSNVAAQSENNVKAMKLAWGTDNLDPREQIAKHDAAQANKKTWVPKPAMAEQARQPPIRVVLEQDPNKALLDAQLKVYEQAIQEEGQLLGNREQMLRSFYDRGQVTAAEYYDRVNKVRQDAIENIKSDYAAEIALLENYKAKYAEGSKEAFEAAGRIAEAQNKIERAVQQNIFSDTRAWMEQDARSAQSGFDRAMGGYIDSATNAGRQIEGALGNAFWSMEDALTRLVTQGKLDFKSLADSIIADLMRIAVRQQILGPMADWMKGKSDAGGGLGGMMGNAVNAMGGAGGLGGLLSGLLGGGGKAVFAKTAEDYIDAGGLGQGASGGMFDGLLSKMAAFLPSFDVGTDSVPHDMIAKIHAGERIVPAAQNKPGFGGLTQHLTINVGGGGVDARTVQQIALQAGMQAQRALSRNG